MQPAAPPRPPDAAEEPHPSGDSRFGLLDKKLKRVRSQPDQLIEVLHVAQELFGYLSEDVLVYLARQFRLPPSRVFGVATFYHLFVLTPQGEHGCTVCMGTACYVKGADRIVEEVGAGFGIGPGATTADGRLTLATARCLGSCGLAPVVVLDGAVIGHATPASTLEAVAARLAAGG
jgi:bidirectional [NiFe] hydrogenase diaphorase subunit